MRKLTARIIQLALAGLLVSGLTTTARAEIGSVRVVFTKGGFIVGVGAGRACSCSAASATRSGSPE